MFEKIHEIKIYLLGRKSPKIIEDTISGFHSQIHVNVPKSNNWRPIHRDDGPAVEYEDGGFEYWQYGQLHRIEGPAIYYPEHDFTEYYLHGGVLEKPIFDFLTASFLNSVKYAELQTNKYTGSYTIGNVRIHLKNGILHNESGPSVLAENNFQLWFLNGVLHRLDGPAVITGDNQKEFWLYGKKRRAHKFAPVVYGSNTSSAKWFIDNRELDVQGFINYIKEHYSEFEVEIDSDKLTFIKDGLPHSEDGPAVIWFNGGLEWRTEGVLNRSSGPAVVSHNGTKMWYKDGKRHRVDGPAIEFPSKRKAWYIEGSRVRRRDYQQIANEYNEKQLVLKNAEELLASISELHLHNIKEINTEELDNYLTDVDEVFNKMLDLNINIDELKTDLINDLHKEITDEKPAEISSDSSEQMNEWILPIVSVAAASFLSLFKKRPVVKSKKKTEKVQQDIKEEIVV